MDRLAESVEIDVVQGPLDFEICPPGSKSITNRALLCAALADGQSRLSGALDSDDTRVMIGCLEALGVGVRCQGNRAELIVDGCSGRFPQSSASLYVENSGTTIRFLTATLGLHGGRYRLTGIDRMHQRPIGALVESLNRLNLDVTTESAGGCPPVVINNSAVKKSQTEISGEVSSQYLSGLMMASPLSESGLRVQLQDKLVSQPYVVMTKAVMAAFGVDLDLNLAQTPANFFCPAGQQYVGADYTIEPDASAASYFWAAAAICGGRVTVTGLNRNSLQGDVGFVNCLEQMGCSVEYGENHITIAGKAEKGIDIDMADISDTVQTLAAVALFVDGPTTVRGVAHNRVKETDRIQDLATELRKLGAEVREHEDGLTILPGKTRPAEIETYNDHRMAMSLALAGLVQPGVIIKNPSCTAKTYPNYFDDLSRLV